MFPEVFLADATLKIVEIEADTADKVVQIRLCNRDGWGNCPSCGQQSRNVHSGYERRLKDLPCSEYAVLVIADQLWLVPTLAPLGLPQPLTQLDANKLTISDPEWWDPQPTSPDMILFTQYLQAVDPAP